MIKRALISVWDKEGVVELAQFLTKNNIEIISTGGTKKTLEDNNIKVKSISDITGMGSVMDGRVKTLDPKIFGSILADRGNSNHLKDLDMIGGQQIDIVVVNLYPFEENAIKKDLGLEESIQYIDIGGPSMLRAAAKNFQNVIPLSSPDLYEKFIELFSKHNGLIPHEDRIFFATKVFQLTSDYENKIFNHFNKSDDDILPDKLNINLYKKSELRYGENPHQRAGFYLKQHLESNLWKQHQGKELSYNNYNDLESAFNIVNNFSDLACIIIKHANPCGFGIGASLVSAYDRAVSTDPVSYFGGIVGFNQAIDVELAEKLVVPFLECIIAPRISKEALEVFSRKKNLRVLTLDQANAFHDLSIKSSAGGFIIQEKDILENRLDSFDIVTQRKINEREKRAMKIGWKIVKYVKSNAIVIANENQVLGIGAGQMSRVDSVKIAIRKIKEAGLSMNNAVLASDAFFPFPDSIELANEHGIKVIIQPGGSIKDQEVISKANKLDVSMVMTGSRHFYH